MGTKQSLLVALAKQGLLVTLASTENREKIAGGDGGKSTENREKISGVTAMAHLTITLHPTTPRTSVLIRLDHPM